MPILRIFSFYLLISAIVSCGKNNDDPNPDNNKPKEDTLTIGWTESKVTDQPLGDVFFQDTQIGYTIGSNLFKTNDGGNSWIKLPDSSGLSNLFITPDGILNAINIPITAFNKYSNWAQNRTTVTLPDFSIHSGDLFFTDNNNGFIVTESAFFHTTDGGATWKKPTVLNGLGFLDPRTFSGLTFLNPAVGWVINGGNIFKTNGSINDWIKCPITGTLFGSVASIQAISNDIVYAGGFSGEILKSTDGGFNFSVIANLLRSPNINFTDIHFLDNTKGFASFNNRIYKTTDGGGTWIMVVGLVQSYFTEIHFTDADHGWACTADGRMVKYLQ